MSTIDIDIPYGKETLRTTLPAGILLGTIEVTDTPGLKDRDNAIRQAIESPIGLDKNIF